MKKIIDRLSPASRACEIFKYASLGFRFAPPRLYAYARYRGLPRRALNAYWNCFSRTNLPALRELELSRVVRILRRQLLQPHHEHEVQRNSQRSCVDRYSPLFKYRLTGPDATRLVDRIITRDMRKVSRAGYSHTLVR